MALTFGASVHMATDPRQIGFVQLRLEHQLEQTMGRTVSIVIYAFCHQIVK